MQRLKKQIKSNYHIFALVFIAVLSFGLNFYAISNNGTGNEYYAACIKSMTQSFHNFFFVSFDPAGMVSVDKPPLGLWTQAISVLVFGYHGWAMLLPQAVAGTASTVLIYILTAKYFGRPAGLISSLIFAVTPIVVVVSRNNTMDMQLVFLLLLAAWLLFRSIDTGKRSYLFLTAVTVGLGFNIKMLQAYMILPAVILTYLIFAKEKFSRRLLSGLIGIVIMVAVSFAWVTAVELYPAESRPYVDSTSNNSMMELIIGHNGTERLFGSRSGGGASVMQRGDSNQDQSNFNQERQMPPEQDGTPPQIPDREDSDRSLREGQDNRDDGFNGADGRDGQRRTEDGQGGNFAGQGRGSEIGDASAVRLWSTNLYGQSSWFLLFAFCSILVCIRWKLLRKKELSQAAMVFWSAWLLTMTVLFSFAGFYHRYYLCMIAPAVAVLSGVGVITMYRGFKKRKEHWRQHLLPIFLLVSFLANLALQIKCIWNYSGLKDWLFLLIAATSGIGLLFLLLYLLRRKSIALILTTAALVISSLTAPLYWALTPVLYVSNMTMPYAGPELAGDMNGDIRGGGNQDKRSNSSSGLKEYLVNHYQEGSFLVVSQRANDVAQFIIDTGLPCYAYGGFLGSDNSLTLDRLKELVSEGKITYFLVSSQNIGGGNSEILSYVKENAVLIDSSKYNLGNSFENQNGSLYLFQ